MGDFQDSVAGDESALRTDGQADPEGTPISANLRAVTPPMTATGRYGGNRVSNILRPRCSKLALMEGTPRVKVEDCERMSAAFVKHRCDTRQAGQLYAAWRDGTRAVRERILTEPELFLKTQRQPPAAKPAAVEQVERDLDIAIAILRRADRRLAEALPEMTGPQQKQAQGQLENARRELNRMTARIEKEQEPKHAEPGTTNRDSGTEREGSEQTRDLSRAAVVAPDGAQSAASKLHRRAGDPTGGESGSVPRTDPGAFVVVHGESRASP